MLPPSKPADEERRRWIATNLEGRVVSVEELKKLFPKQGNLPEIGVTKDTETYKVYGRVLKNLAYECKSCNTVVVGSPNIEDDTSIELGMPLAGRSGYDLYCKQCHAHLEDVTLEMS